eukprot:12894611-Prorocentrum_lima.AAC.1
MGSKDMESSKFFRASVCLCPGVRVVISCPMYACAGWGSMCSVGAPSPSPPAFCSVSSSSFVPVLLLHDLYLWLQWRS